MDYVCRGEEEEEGRNCGKSPLSEYYQDSSDVESASVSASRHEHFSCKSSAGSSPHDSPLRNNFSPLGRFVQHAKDLSPTKPDQSQEEDTLQEPLDFENNGRIWYPPPPEDENDEAESNYFAYDEDDDDDGASCASSDLFELDHLSVIGIGSYREELPVYETTRFNTNRIVSR